MQEIDILRAELERLFELEELLELSRDYLGFDPESVGQSFAKAPFANALTAHCEKNDALEALCDVLLITRPEASNAVEAIRELHRAEHQTPVSGARFANFENFREFSKGPFATSYLAHRGETQYRVKILRREAAHDRRGLNRFATVTRLIAKLEHVGLPRKLEVGSAEGRSYVAHEHVPGVSLAARPVGRVSLRFSEIRGKLRAILEALTALHERRLVHGNLRLENIILAENTERVVLVDAGWDRLRSQSAALDGSSEQLVKVFSKTASPERLRGLGVDARSDLYSFGVLLYELLTGHSPFDSTNGLLAALGHLSETPVPPSQLAERGAIGSELDELVLDLLSKDPKDRPASASAVLVRLDQLPSSAVAAAELSSERLDDLVTRLEANPTDQEAARGLEREASGSEFADNAGEALLKAARRLTAEGADPDASVAGSESSDDAVAWRKALMLGAARVLTTRAETRERAAEVYSEILTLAPDDAAVRSELLHLKRRMRKFDEVVEMLLSDTERPASASDKAQVYAEIGRVYEQHLGHPDQALVAVTQAFCEDPRQANHALEIERLAGSRVDLWNELLEAVMAAIEKKDTPSESKRLLLHRAGRWWAERGQRPELAASCFQAALAIAPGDESALEGLSQIHRRAHQWKELVSVLRQRAEIASTPSNARDLKAEAAEVLDAQLDDLPGARTLYEQVLSDDPAHPKAGTALSKIYERLEDYPALVLHLKRCLTTQQAPAATQTACRIADLYAEELNDPAEAIRRFEAALESDRTSIEALRGLDRLYVRLGRFKELLENLARQIELSTTPRQRITLLERSATVLEREFLDHEKAADCLKRLLLLDPEDAAALDSLARHLRALERWEELCEIYDRQQKALDDPARRTQLLLERARVLAIHGSSAERAGRAYEAVLAIDPEEPQALKALAELREAAGDASGALTAIESLAERAPTPEARAELWVRAARLLEDRDREASIERYKRALDANPKNGPAATGLVDAYTASGDLSSLVRLLERQVEQTEGDLAQSALLGRISLLCRDGLRDDRKAEEFAKRARRLNQTEASALLVLGDLAFEDKRYLEAGKHYEALIESTESPDPASQIRLLMRQAEAFSRAGLPEKALQPVEMLLRLKPDDIATIQSAADLVFEHGTSERAAELYAALARKLPAEHAPADRARVLYRLGEALRRSAKFNDAVRPLEEAADLDGAAPDSLIALASTYEAQGKWAEAIKIKLRHLELANGEDRVQLLLDVSEIAGTKLNDRAQAAKSLIAALDERPDDRRLLTRLMQLYSEDRDWHKLVDVVLKLADFVDDPEQRVKYLHTAAIVTARQIGDTTRALEFYEQVLELDPAFEKAITGSIDLRKKRGEHTAVERLLKRKFELASSSNDQQAMISSCDELGELYQNGIGSTPQAVDAYEAAQALDPANPARAERLRRLYGSDPERYLEKAVQSEFEALQKSPLQAEPYRAMRHLYTESKRPDEAWCLCQALVVLGLAEPDEERFFRRMRSETAAPAQAVLSDEDWLQHLMHPDADPLLTSVFALIEPALIARRSASLTELGYDEQWLVDVALHPAPICQSLHHASDVLGVALPPCYQNPNDAGGVSLLFAHEPSLALGVTALSPDVPLCLAGFIAAHRLAYLRPGMVARHLLASGTALKAWLLAAIKLSSPTFPVAAELEGAVNEALDALDGSLRGQARDHLTRVVVELLTSGAALDLKRWVKAIDLSADRVGFLIAHDLTSALDVLRASEDGVSSVPTEDRVNELLLYSVSPPYLTLRRKLGISVDS